jgi:hypothetical protein
MNRIVVLLVGQALVWLYTDDERTQAGSTREGDFF